MYRVCWRARAAAPRSEARRILDLGHAKLHPEVEPAAAPRVGGQPLRASRALRAR